MPETHTETTTSTTGRDAAETATPKRQSRLSINVNQEAADFLDDITVRRDISITEAVRRALALYKLLDDHTNNGHHVQIDDGKRVRDIILV